MSLPTFNAKCMEAYASMNSQDSPNDYFVCGFPDEESKARNELGLVELGRGGLAKVKTCLEEKFESGIAVAMFRVTAVDSRGTTTSYRTKLVHVIYVGPKTPVLTRAKVASYNKALKEGFTMNLSLQLDNVDDISEVSVEKQLRSSGGAHQPTSFDFKNEEIPSPSSKRPVGGEDVASEAPKEEEENTPTISATTTESNDNAGEEQEEEEDVDDASKEEEEKTKPSPTNEEEENAGEAPADSSSTPSFAAEENFRARVTALKALDVDRLVSFYDEDSVVMDTRLVFGDSQLDSACRIYHGREKIREWYEGIVSMIREDMGAGMDVHDGEEGANSPPVVELGESEPTIHQNKVVSFTWSSPSLAFCSDTAVMDLKSGKIAHQTMVGGVLASRVVEDMLNAQMEQMMLGGGGMGLESLLSQLTGANFSMAGPGDIIGEDDEQGGGPRFEEIPDNEGKEEGEGANDEGGFEAENEGDENDVVFVSQTATSSGIEIIEIGDENEAEEGEREEQ